MRVSARSCQSIPVLNKIRAEAQRSLRRFFTRSRGAAERLVRPDRPVFRSGDAAYGNVSERKPLGGERSSPRLRVSACPFNAASLRSLPLCSTLPERCFLLCSSTHRPHLPLATTRLPLPPK